MHDEKRKPLITIVGPTTSGKSDFAVRIAKKNNGEIISADSRQVYRGMDIGTGKVPAKFRNGKYVYKGIVHYGIDIVSPRTNYSVAQFQKYAKKIIADIHARGKIPVLCGGTGFWIDAVAYNQDLPEVKPDPKLRKRLQQKTPAQLYAMLQKRDPKRAASIDRHNPHRLIRSLEIVMTTRKPVPILRARKSPYDVQWIGLNPGQDHLFQAIEKRLKKRLKQGMLHEISRLHKDGVSWKRLESFGLEYKYGALHLQKKLSYEKMYDQLLAAIKKYTKRQMTWWKRNKDIAWVKD